MVDHRKIEEAVRMILEAVGEDPNREGLLDTPKRVARMYEEIFSGLNKDPKDQFSVVFSEDHEELVLVKDIPFSPLVSIIWFRFSGKPILVISRAEEE